MTALMLCIVLIPFAFAVFNYFLSKKHTTLGNAFSIVFCLIELSLVLFCVSISQGETIYLTSANMSFKMDGFRAIYAIIISLMWFAATLIIPQYFKDRKPHRFIFFLFVTLGATIGVFLSADLYTTFLFFEIMSFASYAWVIEDETKAALSAGKTYLAVSVIGGLVTLMGIFILYKISGTLDIEAIKTICEETTNKSSLYAAAFCILVGFGAKAGLFPLHIWLPKAYPAAPTPASALLSSVLTKAGLFGIIIVSSNILFEDVLWGYTLLILGAITMLLGALIAVFSTNLKYVLACSSLSQIGFIIIGIALVCLLGEENSIAANGTILYMINHSMVKISLFLIAGVIYANIKTLELNDIRGFGRNKPFLKIIFIIAAASICGIPGFCGYISKTLVHEAIVEYTAIGGGFLRVIEVLFLTSGGLTIAYITKLYVAIFVEKPAQPLETQNKKYINKLSMVAISIGAITLPVFGLLPHFAADKISSFGLDFLNGEIFSETVNYFSLENLKGFIISLSIGIIVYFVLIRKCLIKNGSYINRLPKRFSIEKSIYIPVINGLYNILWLVCKVVSEFAVIIIYICRKTVLKARKNKADKFHPFLTSTGNFYDRIKGNDENKTSERLIDAVTTIRKTSQLIFGNLSFALLMTCLGICAILIYLIFN